MDKSTRIVVRMEPELKKAVLAKADQWKLSSIVRQLLIDWLASKTEEGE